MITPKKWYAFEAVYDNNHKYLYTDFVLYTVETKIGRFFRKLIAEIRKKFSERRY